MKSKLAEISLAALWFALALFLSCADNSDLEFPSKEEMRERYSSSSVAENSSSSSETEVSWSFSSSSFDESSSSLELASSSSFGESSSSLEVVSSSSSVQSSSSSEPVSSSSSVQSSSSSEPVSSSSSVQSSSSSEPVSSSSSEQSSSSAPEECADIIFNPANKFCYEGNVYDRCGGESYNLLTHRCESGIVVPSVCGTRTEKFNSNLYECRTGDKIYLKTPVFYEGEDYEAVLIGTHTWMARNLNYNVANSRCYGEDGEVFTGSYDNSGNPINATLTSDEVQANCEKYGRLYDWATAMALDPSCNSSSCSSQISAKHKGICPSGWHIPTVAEWSAMGFVGSSLITELKSTSGWTDYYGNYGNPDGNGKDIYGFSALPGGLGWDNFCCVGSSGYWWSASELNSHSHSSYAHNRDMNYDGESVFHGNYVKSLLFSVRCVKD